LKDLCKDEAMGMWIELGIFIVVILFALHQIRDVRREQRKREASRSEAVGPKNRADEEKKLKNMFGISSNIGLSLRRNDNAGQNLSLGGLHKMPSAGLNAAGLMSVETIL